jgi:hypothetical protein
MHLPAVMRQGGGQRQPVEVEEGIAVHHEERLVELVGCVDEGACGAGGLRLDHDLDLELAEAFAGVPRLDRLGAVAGQEQQLQQPEPARLVDDVVQKRLSPHFQHGFGELVGQGAQSGSASADKADRLCDGHCAAGIYALRAPENRSCGGPKGLPRA